MRTSEMDTHARFYVELDADTEVEVSVVTRTYNGMDSDPKVVLRHSEFGEMKAALAAVNLGEFRLVPGLDFPVQEFASSSPATLNPQPSTSRP